MAAIDRLRDMDAVARLRAKDPSLFASEPSAQQAIANRLGWVEVAGQAPAPVAAAHETAARFEDADDVVLLGMGGSSLASLVISSVIGGSRRLHVLDTVAPRTIASTIEAIDPARTVYVVASKSGGTIEPNVLYAIFRAHADAQLGEAAGERFVAITDPGTSLALLAEEAGFATCISAPADVGGRFSALTAFGLVPAALIGVDVDRLIERGSASETECADAYDSNPAVELASFISDAQAGGADKLTIVADERLRSFGLWVEQLVAESLGKDSQGVVPVVELADAPSGYGSDRALVVMRLTGDTRLADYAQSQRGRHPVYEIVFDDAYDVAEEFVRFEHAIALVGALLDVNPFNEPNVSEAKAATTAVLEKRQSASQPTLAVDDIAITFAGALADPGHAERSAATAIGHALASLRPRDYVAILGFLPDDPDLLAPLHEATAALSSSLGNAVCLEIGPRYLHSTGQLHKGGPDNGVFIMVTTRDEVDQEIPGQPWSLRELHLAQADGDLITLAAHDRRVMRLELPDASSASVSALAEALGTAVGLRGGTLGG